MAMNMLARIGESGLYKAFMFAGAIFGEDGPTHERLMAAYEESETAHTP